MGGALVLFNEDERSGVNDESKMFSTLMPQWCAKALSDEGFHQSVR